MKAIVIYETKYGNTKQVAEIIAEGMSEVEGMEATVNHVKDVDISKISEYGVLVVGSPNHAGGPTGSVKKLIKQLEALTVKAAVFDTYMGKDFGKAVKKLEKYIGKKAPGMELVVPGLSIQVQGMKGPVVDGEFTKCTEFGRSVAAKIMD